MKFRKWKTPLAISLGLLWTVSCLAQGTIIFNNSSSQLIRMTPTTAAPIGTHVAFYYSPTPVSDPMASALHLISGGVATIAPVAGQFNGGTKTTDVDAAGGSTIYVSIRGWTGNYATWDAAFAAMWSGAQVWLAASPVFSMPTGNPNGSPPTLPTALSTIPGFTGLLFMPEPTTFALAGLGTAALLIFRRRS